MGLQQFNENFPYTAQVVFTSGSSPGALVDLVGAGPQRRLDLIQVLNSTPSSVVVSFFYQIGGGAANQIGSVTVASGSGVNGAAMVDALANIMPSNYHYLLVAQGDVVAVTYSPSFASGIVVVNAFGGFV